jgi:predicted metalloprotease
VTAQRTAVLLGTLMLALAGCGGGDDSAQAPTVTAAPAASRTPTPTGDDSDRREVPIDEVNETIRASAREAQAQFEQLEGIEPATTSDQLRTSTGGTTTTTQTMEQFLTTVIGNVDRYWTGMLTRAGQQENQVTYSWLAPGATETTGCVAVDGTQEVAGDRSAAYCPSDDTIRVSQQFAKDLWDGLMDDELPGSAAGRGHAGGDFAVAYVVAHEYAHSVQQHLNLYGNYGQLLPVEAFELQADCMAGTWSNSVYYQGLLEQGDVEEALDAALAVGSFDSSQPGFHGTPDERYEAFKLGYDTGNPAACNRYLNPNDVALTTNAGADSGTGGGGVIVIGG